MGMTYFNANVDIDEDDLFTEVTYGYTGVFVGLHLGY